MDNEDFKSIPPPPPPTIAPPPSIVRSNGKSIGKTIKLPTDQYLDQTKIPEEWFMPMGDLNSDFCRTYMDQEARMRTIKVMLDTMVKEKEAQRRTKK